MAHKLLVNAEPPTYLFPIPTAPNLKPHILRERTWMGMFGTTREPLHEKHLFVMGLIHTIFFFAVKISPRHCLEC